MAGARGMGGDGNPNLDWLGILYITFTILWTALVSAGLLYLYYLRGSIAIRIRNLWLVASAVIMLNLYQIAVLIRYPMNGLFKCGVEFWMMSTLLPLSIALFQASNIQLLSYYDEQQHIANLNFRKINKSRLILDWRSLRQHWRQLSAVQKTYVGIAAGIVLQLTVTLIIFFGSRAFHSYGFFGSTSRAGKCRHTPEWIPSIFWQFLWSAVFGPYVLFRIRSIRDTHYWALQTRLAIIACLPGTPLWLIFRYADTEATRSVNKYIVPAFWILPGLAVMQSVSIVIPILDARRETLFNERAASIYSNSSSKSKDEYSMHALEQVIDGNIEALLEWTSKKEFTAENVVFLKQVRDFKRKWRNIGRNGDLSPLQGRDCFAEAGKIYFNLIDRTTAPFNINIDSSTYNKLKSIFTALFNVPRPGSQGSEDKATPWDNSLPSSISKVRLVEDLDRIYQSQVPGIELKEFDKDVIPAEFNITIFDSAFESIKYLVFTNSWVKFVDARETASINESILSDNSKNPIGRNVAIA